MKKIWSDPVWSKVIEHYTQRERIADLFGYQSWAADFLPQLVAMTAQTVRRDVMPGFIAAELIVWLNEHKIIRPGYTTLQELVSEALSAERRRLGGLLAEVLDEPAKAALAQLLVRDDTLSQLAALKQDAKDFGWRQMARVCGATQQIYVTRYKIVTASKIPICPEV